RLEVRLLVRRPARVVDDEAIDDRALVAVLLAERDIPPPDRLRVDRLARRGGLRGRGLRSVRNLGLLERAPAVEELLKLRDSVNPERAVHRRPDQSLQGLDRVRAERAVDRDAERLLQSLDRVRPELAVHRGPGEAERHPESLNRGWTGPAVIHDLAGAAEQLAKRRLLCR